MRFDRSAILLLALMPSVGCDAPVQTVAENSPVASAGAPSESAYVAAGRVDLKAVVDGVADGSIGSAAELETKLASESVASVDLDADGKRDELRIVERRTEKASVLEIRALPSAKVKADADVEIETAPVVAELQLEAHADEGTAVARASFSAAFVARAKIEANVPVEHTFTGLRVTDDGAMAVDAEAKPFVSWSFRSRRPAFVAEVFIAKRGANEDESDGDPCWPPGHCKHGLWKATGERQPGQERKLDDATGDDKGKPDKDDKDKSDKDKDDKGKPDKDDKDKSDKDDKGKSDDHGQPGHAKSDKHDPPGKDPGAAKGNKPEKPGKSVER